MLFIWYLWVVKYYWVPISLIVVKVWAIPCPPVKDFIFLCETLPRLVLYRCSLTLFLDLPCFSVVRSLTSWYAFLLLFFLRHASTSWHWPCIQVSFAIFISVLLFLLISLYTPIVRLKWNFQQLVKISFYRYHSKCLQFVKMQLVPNCFIVVFYKEIFGHSILSKKETLHAFFLKLKLQNNFFKHCDVFLSLCRHQTTRCTNLFSDLIIYCRFIQHTGNIKNQTMRMRERWFCTLL